MPFEVGTFQAPGATGDQDITHSLGEAPTFVMFFAVGATAFDSWQTTPLWVTGFAHNTTAADQKSTGWASDNDVAVPNTGRWNTSDGIAVFDASQNADSKFTVTVLDSSKIRIDWSDVPASQTQYIWVAGSGCDAKAIEWVGQNNVNNQSVTSVGFQPKVALHATDVTGTAAGAGTSARWMTGAMSGTGSSQWTIPLLSVDAGVTTNTQRGWLDDRLHSRIQGSLVLDRAADFVQWLSNGFEIDWIGTSDAQVFTLALGGSRLSAKVGNFSKSTSGAPASQAVTGVGFKPQLVLFFSSMRTATGGIEHTRIAMGAADGSNEASMIALDEDAVALSNADRRISNTKALMLANNATPTVDAECDLTSFDSDGFTVNWTTNDANAYRVGYIALATAPLDSALKPRVVGQAVMRSAVH